VLDRHDIVEVERLRVTGYEAAGEFDVLDAELLRWDDHDERGGVVGAWLEGRLVSTLRGVLVEDRKGAESLFMCTIDLPASYYPGLLFGRASTLPEHRRLGLNALLRLHFLRAALADERDGRGAIGASIVMPYEGAPRLRLLGELGYVFHRPSEVWDPELRGHRPPLIGVMPRGHVPAAVSTLERVTSELEPRFAWEGPQLHLPPAILANTV
jgi:hypothetical protein